MHFFRGTVSILMLAGMLAAQGPPAATPAASPSQDASSRANGSSPAKGVEATSPSRDSTTAAATEIVVPAENPHDNKEAKREFSAGVRLKSAGKTEAGFEKFEAAARLNPRNVEYLTAREFTRQQLVMEALDRGNRALQAGNEVTAMAEFRRALEYDPGNEFATQRLRDSIWQTNPVASHTLQMVDRSIAPDLSPSSDLHDFHFRGDARTLLTQLARAYGITALFDDSVKSPRIHFDIEKVNFATAMEAAASVTKTFWVPLSGSQMYILADTVENRRGFERLAMRTFYLPDISSPQELSDLVSALRVVLDIRFVLQNPAESTITIRAPKPLVEAATHMIDSLSGGRPQVMLDVRVFQISSSLVRQMGMTLPTQFTMFNISPALIASLGKGAQDLINQLIASGGINQANSQAIQALLAQLQQSTQSSILSQPFATFGGGLTLTGITATNPGVGTTLNLNESDVRDLSHVTLRASQNTAAVLKLGERYPIVNATFAPIYNTAAISKILGNQTYTAPFPSFSFEDLGLSMKATPIIHSDAEVSLKLEMQVRSLAGQSVNGIPVIANRQYSGSITLKNAEAGVVAGLLSKDDSRSLSGYPFLSRVPVATYASSLHDKNVNEDELLVIITPHILRMASNEGFAMQLPVGH